MKKGDTKNKSDVSKKTPAKSVTPKKSVPMKKSDEVKTSTEKESVCCPEFSPKSWNEKEVKWKDKFFVKDTVISVFHIPLNFGSVIKKNYAKIEAAKAGTKNPIVVMDEISPFCSHVYISITKPIAECHDVKLTGNFLSKVFEGSYKNMKKWVKEMDEYVKSKGKETKRNYFFYPTCPKCSKKYGKNYVVILAEI